jgi:hypothetical protein
MSLKEKAIKTLPTIIILFSITLLTNISEQYLNMKLQIEMRSESSAFFLIVFLIVTTSLFGVFLQEAVFLLSIERHQPQHQFPLATRFIDLIKENLKAIGSASLWMFVFIIPGLIKWIEYSLLPFVVFLNPDYQKGDREALSLSIALVKKSFWKFFLFWILFNCVIPICLSVMGGEYESFKETPLIATLLSLIESLIFWSWMLILWDFYEENCRKLKIQAI